MGVSSSGICTRVECDSLWVGREGREGILKEVVN